jgi:anti-sigma B factor antagonist
MSVDQQIVVERNSAGAATLQLRGEHDVYTAPTLREQLMGLTEEGVSVVIDLDQATFIDSSILGVLLGGLRRAREQGSGFAIVLSDAGDPTVRRIFEVTGLYPVFPVHTSRDEAVAAATRPGGGG